MVLELLADRVNGMEESSGEWEALCREILSTITLEANKEYFSVLDDTWHNKVDTWVSQFHELESAKPSVQADVCKDSDVHYGPFVHTPEGKTKCSNCGKQW